MSEWKSAQHALIDMKADMLQLEIEYGYGIDIFFINYATAIAAAFQNYSQNEKDALLVATNELIRNLPNPSMKLWLKYIFRKLKNIVK